MSATRHLPEMLKIQPTDQYKAGIITAGMVCLLYALATLPTAALSLGFLVLILFACFVAPRMTLTLPRSKFYISFSDSVVFFTFLVYGGETAIVVAFIETLANCIYLKRNSGLSGRWVLIWNSSLATLVTTVIFVAYSVF